MSVGSMCKKKRKKMKKRTKKKKKEREKQKRDWYLRVVSEVRKAYFEW